MLGYSITTKEFIDVTASIDSEAGKLVVG